MEDPYKIFFIFGLLMIFLLNNSIFGVFDWNDFKVDWKYIKIFLFWFGLLMIFLLNNIILGVSDLKYIKIVFVIIIIMLILLILVKL